MYNIPILNSFLILFGKFISSLSRVVNLGHGSTWPGHIALSINKNFISQLISYNSELRTILIAGTNGKTTTGRLIQTILEQNGLTVFQNEAGANLLNGVASVLIQHSNIVGKIDADFAIFEIDENTLPLVLQEITPDYLILLNLFRDQLDRYGEVNTIAKKWKIAFSNLPQKTTIILNADDPQIAYLGITRFWTSQNDVILGSRATPESHPQVLYFGLNDKSLAQTTAQHAADSTYCPNCNAKLIYKTVYFSHLGDWKCPKCKFARGPLAKISPFNPLTGVYNRYNTLAAALLAKANNVSDETIQQSLKSFSPAFGRQEKITVDNKDVQIFLSKNPTSFNESLRTVRELKGKNILLVLNDRIPDGRDVSWIWDVDFEDFIEKDVNITISGDRCYDMGLRIKYKLGAQKSKLNAQNYNAKLKIYENLQEALEKSLDSLNQNETLYILPTYSAMLETRKILTGRKIL